MKINELLRQSSELLENISDSPMLDARVLMCEALGKDMTYLITHARDEMPEDASDVFAEMIKKRSEHMPVAYIINKKEFMSMDFFVDERVLIPRADTEILVEKAVGLIGDKNSGVLDMCCGSGCIGLSVKKYAKNISLTLADISEGAIQVTKKNAINHFPGNDNINIIQTDLFENIDGKFDYILSNPPYISYEEMKDLSEDILSYEPHNALEAENDGLYFYEKIISLSGEYLNENGTVIFEIGYSQAKAVSEIFEKNGFTDIEVIKDLAGLDRVLLGRKI